MNSVLDGSLCRAYSSGNCIRCCLALPKTPAGNPTDIRRINREFFLRKRRARRHPQGVLSKFPDVEQNVQEGLELAHHAYVLQTGRIVMEGKPADLLQTDMIKRAYLGL
jgi:hypothetical protein